MRLALWPKIPNTIRFDTPCIIPYIHALLNQDNPAVPQAYRHLKKAMHAQPQATIVTALSTLQLPQKKSIALLQTWLNNHPNFTYECQMTLGDLYLTIQDTQTALNHYQKAADHKKTALIMTKLAHLHAQNHQPQLTKSLLEQAIELHQQKIDLIPEAS